MVKKLLNDICVVSFGAQVAQATQKISLFNKIKI